MNDGTQMGDFKILLAPCLNWEAVLRSVLLLIMLFHWTPHLAQVTIVGLKVLHELRSRVINYREWTTLHSRRSCQDHHRGSCSLSLTTVYTGSAITV